MDCKHMIEINDKGLFQDYITGLKYHEITQDMIEDRLDDELDSMWGPWIDPQTMVIFSQAARLKTLDPEEYSEHVIDYMRRNNIIALDCEEGLRYFEFDKDENDVR